MKGYTVKPYTEVKPGEFFEEQITTSAIGTAVEVIEDSNGKLEIIWDVNVAKEEDTGCKSCNGEITMIRTYQRIWDGGNAHHRGGYERIDRGTHVPEGNHRSFRYYYARYLGDGKYKKVYRMLSAAELPYFFDPYLFEDMMDVAMEYRDEYFAAVDNYNSINRSIGE
jgi:hypothetical protein